MIYRKFFILIACYFLLANSVYGQEDVSIPSDESSLSEKDAGTLDQELKGLQLQEGQMPQQTQPSSNSNNVDNKSLKDTLLEGLKSLFSGDEKEEKEKQQETTITPPTQPPAGKFTPHALLQGLNKITARTSSLDVTIDEPINFGTLEITVHKCWKTSPEEMQENKALLEIWEQKPGEEKSQIFYGWMFASSPSISALENPIYDVTVVGCTEKGK